VSPTPTAPCAASAKAPANPTMIQLFFMKLSLPFERVPE
jgi:hypothetical protein